MKCELCSREFAEGEIHESHNVPCYLFKGNRKGQKNHADKYGRHNICKECHDKYEEAVRLFLIEEAIEFSISYFKEGKNGDTNP